MRHKEHSENGHQPGFSEIIKKAYEKGHFEQEMTVKQLVEQLKLDLQNMMVN